MHKPRHGTAWSKHTQSPVKGSQKGKSLAAEVAKKSKDVRRIERLIESLNTGLAPPSVRSDGCFCQARVHLLSSYVPMCPHCGLILCLLQHPAHLCPFCNSPLLSTHVKNALMQKLHLELSAVLQKEADALQEQQHREGRAAVSFPVLSGAVRSSPNIHTPSQAPSEPRKVLSLNSRTKKVTVSSFTRPSPAGSAGHSDVEEDEFSAEAVPPRVPPPPNDPLFISRRGTERRWQNLHEEGYSYVQEPQPTDEAGPGKSRKRKTTGVKEKS